MKIPIRIIGIATSIFWVFLIIFSVSALYSLKDVRLEFGEPQINLAQNDRMLFSFPLSIVNKGYYDLDDFNASAEILQEQNQTAACGCTCLPVIGREETINTTLEMELNLTEFFQDHPYFLFNDTELGMNITVIMKAAEVIPIQVSSNQSIPWGAPLYNFTLGTPEFRMTVSQGSTVLYRVIVPASFENHAFFDLAGTLRLRMYNNTNASIGEDQIAIEAKQSLSYHENLEFYVPATSLTEEGHFEIFLVAPFFNYGPLVIPYGQ